LIKKRLGEAYSYSFSQSSKTLVVIYQY